jgi:hypothetical protein
MGLAFFSHVFFLSPFGCYALIYLLNGSTGCNLNNYYSNFAAGNKNPMHKQNNFQYRK